MQLIGSRYERRKTRQIHVGAVAVGGDAPITVQSMTITKTADHEATLQQIYALAAADGDVADVDLPGLPTGVAGLADLHGYRPLPFLPPSRRASPPFGRQERVWGAITETPGSRGRGRSW